MTHARIRGPRAVHWWLPAIALLCVWLAIFTVPLAEGESLSLVFHRTIGFWWREVNSSLLTRAVTLLLFLPPTVILARGVVRQDQRFVAIGVFLCVLIPLISMFVIGLMFAAAMGG